MFVDKDRELSEAQAEIKALRLSERLRETSTDYETIYLPISLSKTAVSFSDQPLQHFLCDSRSDQHLDVTGFGIG